MGDAIAGVWKSLALVCVTILVAGAPGIVYAIRTWGIQGDVKVIRDRQDDVRIRLSILEQQEKVLEQQIRELREELFQHAQNG